MIKEKRELRNIGINPIEELSVQEKTHVAEKVAHKLASLNIDGIKQNEILEKLFEAKMYTAQTRSNLRKVNYLSLNKTIYFDKNLNLENINEEILHECICYLQDKVATNKRIGVCTFEKYKVRGRALNEIGISYICNKILNNYNKTKTFTLLNQILLVTGEKVFLDSILNNNNKFEEKFIKQTNSETLYYKIQNAFDTIFDLEKIINRLNQEGRESTNPAKYLNKINMHKHTLNTKFDEIQWEIYNRYFSRKIELISGIDEAKKYKNEIFNFNQWLEISDDELKYTNFATEKIERLNRIETQIFRKNANNSMILIGDGIFSKVIRIFKKLILKPKEYEEE